MLVPVHNEDVDAVFDRIARMATMIERAGSADRFAFFVLSDSGEAAEAEARRRWPIVECAMVHRLGHLLPGQASVGIAVSAAHRQEAFEAGRWLIDTLKQVVPIWKKENWADGTTEWVHPDGHTDQKGPES